jgi:putative FmdB family regulatory protein
MPIYEYVCEGCKEPFEKLVLKSSEKITCPKCGGRHHTLQFSIVASPAKSGGSSSSFGGEFNPAASGGGGCCSPGGCGCH